MPRNKSPDTDEEFAGTASRSGYDSASQKARGKVKEAEGKLTDDEKLKDEGETQQYLADTEAKEDLKPWRREHHKQ